MRRAQSPAQRRLRADYLGNRHRPVQRHDGRGAQALEKIVEPEDLRPVRILGPRSLTMHGRDSRFESETTGPGAKRLLDQRQRLGDLPLVPKAAILLFQKDKIACFIETGSAP